MNGFFEFPENDKNVNSHRDCHQEIGLIVKQIQKEDYLKGEICIKNFDREALIFFYFVPNFELVFEGENFQDSFCKCHYHSQSHNVKIVGEKKFFHIIVGLFINHKLH